MKIRDVTMTVLIPLAFGLAVLTIVSLSGKNTKLETRVAVLESELRGTKSTAENIKDAVEEINRNTNCTMTFYALENRDNLIIKDRKDCTIVNTKTGEEKQLLSPAPTPSLDSSTPKTNKGQGTEKKEKKDQDNSGNAPESSIQEQLLQIINDTIGI